jgi:hypothetical protein
MLCFFTATAGRSRAAGFWGVFALSVLLTPAVMGLILLISAPKYPQGS